MEEKASLEDEIKNRNEEMYAMNQKMIFMEFDKQQVEVDDNGQGLVKATSNKVQDLKMQLEFNWDANVRRVFDM